MIIKFIRSMFVLIHLFHDGFFFSYNVHHDKDGKMWGFYRLNFENNNQKDYAILDIDFSEGIYYHIHADNSIYRVNLNNRS